MVLLLTLALGTATWWIWRDMQRFLDKPVALTEPTIYTIKPGMSLRAVSNDLAVKNILEKPLYLIAAGRRLGMADKLKAGEYEIRPGTTPLHLLNQFVDGLVVQYNLTLLEGWTFNQVMDAIRNCRQLESTLTTNNPERIMEALGQPGIAVEGQFFPDTYHFPAGTTDLEFLRRANRLLLRILDEEWEQRSPDLPYQTPYEALIMASIIEKETGRADEREKIAGVFVRRMQKGMKLQTDPTVIYALGESYNGNIRRNDLAIDSPFNTYLYAKLPPTPIALSGRESIHAALHPEDGTALYFVSMGDGSHYFSSTLEEHNRAVTKYQLHK